MSMSPEASATAIGCAAWKKTSSGSTPNSLKYPFSTPRKITAEDVSFSTPSFTFCACADASVAPPSSRTPSRTASMCLMSESPCTPGAGGASAVCGLPPSHRRCTPRASGGRSVRSARERRRAAAHPAVACRQPPHEPLADPVDLRTNAPGDRALFAKRPRGERPGRLRQRTPVVLPSLAAPCACLDALPSCRRLSIRGWPMRSLLTLGRRRFTVGGLVVAAWGVVRELAGAGRAGAQGGVQMPAPRGGMQMQKEPQQQQKRGGQAPLRAKVKSFEVGGGSKPGDTVTLRLTIETTGAGSKNVPWTISRDNDVVIKSDTRQNVGGGTTFEVNTTWTATAGPHDFYGVVDPQNTLGEPAAQRGDNTSARTTRVFSDWPRWLSAAKTGTRTAVSAWGARAMFTGIRIDGPFATGGRVVGPDLGGAIHAALTEAGMPGNLASGFGHAVDDIWRAWTDTIRVPGLPWYPSFAAFPAPQAPPTPNVPTPLASLAQDPGKLAP